MNANAPQTASLPRPSQRPRRLDLQAIFSWLLADGIVEKDKVKAHFAQAQGILKNAAGSMHPLTAVAQCKLLSNQPPHRLLTLDILTEWCAAKVGLPFIRIDPLKIDFTRVADVMSASYAARFNILPVDMNATTLTVATADPFAIEWENEIARISRRRIELVLANPLDIAQYISQFFSLAKSIRDASKTNAQDVALRNNFEQLVEMGKANKQFDANDQHIVNIVDWLWGYAFEQRASDIHLEPKREFAAVRFRIDGVLHQVYQVPAAVMLAMTARIKLLGRMDVIEKRRPQDGRIKTRTHSGQEVELRLSTMPTAFGEKLVMRIFDPEVVVKTLPELGFPPVDAQRWDALTNRPHGIILVTGPTGSGKTTTLYTTLKALATNEVNVCTVEDPIEMVEASFNQMQVQPGIDLSFADGVRALMRQDPDIIMVGEIRDRQTAEIAVQAALTGHLVLTTLHTNDTLGAVARLVEMGVEPYLLSSALIGVMAQRLVRRICPACKTGYLVPPGAALAYGWKGEGNLKLQKGRGCPSCYDSGYKGRLGIYELLEVGSDLQRMIVANASKDALVQHVAGKGHRDLYADGMERAFGGDTTPEEIARVVHSL